jgi:hypothetical protein
MRTETLGQLFLSMEGEPVKQRNLMSPGTW